MSSRRVFFWPSSRFTTAAINNNVHLGAKFSRKAILQTAAPVGNFFSGRNFSRSTYVDKEKRRTVVVKNDRSNFEFLSFVKSVLSVSPRPPGSTHHMHIRQVEIRIEHQLISGTFSNAKCAFRVLANSSRHIIRT